MDDVAYRAHQGMTANGAHSKDQSMDDTADGGTTRIHRRTKLRYLVSCIFPTWGWRHVPCYVICVVYRSIVKHRHCLLNVCESFSFFNENTPNNKIIRIMVYLFTSWPGLITLSGQDLIRNPSSSHTFLVATGSSLAVHSFKICSTIFIFLRVTLPPRHVHVVPTLRLSCIT